MPVVRRPPVIRVVGRRLAHGEQGESYWMYEAFSRRLALAQILRPDAEQVVDVPRHRAAVQGVAEFRARSLGLRK